MGPPIAQLTPEQQKQLEALQQAEERIAKKLLKGAWTYGSAPFKFMFDLVKDSPAHAISLSGWTVRTLKGKGIGLTLTIAATQIIWEAIETVISFSIGLLISFISSALFPKILHSRAYYIWLFV